MKVYFAKVNIGIPPYGIVTVGEVLKDHHIEALGSERVAEMLKEKALGVQHDTDPAPAPLPIEENHEEADAAEDAEQQDSVSETGEETDEADGSEEEADELVLPMDELVKDAPEEAVSKPAQNTRKGKAKKNENQDA